MASLGGLNSYLTQNVVPIAQAVSELLLSSARTLGSASGTSRCHSPANHQLEEKHRTQELSLLDGLGLHDLPRALTVSRLSPLLACRKCADLLQPQETDPRLFWRQKHTSAESFFENKNGFPESDLRLYRTLLTQAHNSLHNPVFHQHVRGFKSKSSNRGSGALGRKKTEDSLFRQKAKDWNEWLWAKPKQNAKIRELIDNDKTHSPESAEKMKIAFAEGYAANTTAAPGGVNWRRIINTTIALCILVWFAWPYVVGVNSKTGVRGGGKPGLVELIKGDNNVVVQEDINVTFDDVKGADEAKEELQDLVYFLKEPEKFKELGAKLPKGVLLSGPPGTGKTLLARAVAGEAGVPFLRVSGSEFDEMFVGTGAKRVRQLFNTAKENAPSVVFIDEIDAVGGKRSTSSVQPYANQTINQLLSEMDGFEQNEGVIVIGATNRLDHLDPALIRPGRFDTQVHVAAPDYKGRLEILELYLSKITQGPDIDSARLARSTTGCTGAELENIINQGAVKAALDNAQHVTMDHLEFGRDKVLMGPAKKHRIPDHATNLMTAYHEAGHTLVAYYTKGATPLNKVTIMPRGSSLGHTSFLPEKDQYNASVTQLLANMDVAMGGRVAEEVIYGTNEVTTGASSDFRNATDIAVSMVKHYGMSEKVGVRTFRESGGRQEAVSSATSELVDAEIKRLLEESYERATVILKNHSVEHHALTEALMEYETLDAKDVKSIVNDCITNKVHKKTNLRL